MRLIEGAVHSHGDGELVEVAVLPHPVDHGGQAGAAELGGAAGHHAAHLLHQHAVVTGGAGQAQVLQDGADLPHGQAVAGGGRESGPASSHRFTFPFSSSVFLPFITATVQRLIEVVIKVLFISVAL